MSMFIDSLDIHHVNRYIQYSVWGTGALASRTLQALDYGCWESCELSRVPLAGDSESLSWIRARSTCEVGMGCGEIPN